MKIHPYAYLAALASMAAYEQGKFWEMSKLLFENYNNLNADVIIELARKIDLDMNLFKQSLFSFKYKEAIDSDIAQGISLGIKGTPTFFINGHMLSGFKPYEAFKTIIDKELSRDK